MVVTEQVVLLLRRYPTEVIDVFNSSPDALRHSQFASRGSTSCTRRKPPQNKFLHEPIGHSAPRCNQRILEHNSCAAIRAGIVDIGDGTRRQITPDIRIVWLPLAVVSLTYEGVRKGVKGPRPFRTRSLIKVPRILM